MMPVESPFKRGTTYTRKEVGQVLLPETGRPAGGMWDTGYVRVGNFLVVFMNIGVPGKGGFDFDNDYDPATGLIRWFGNPNHIANSPPF